MLSFFSLVKIAQCRSVVPSGLIGCTGSRVGCSVLAQIRTEWAVRSPMIGPCVTEVQKRAEKAMIGVYK